MKRKVYIALFVLLGILVQFLVHGWLEVWYIGLLLADFSKYSLGMSWAEWFNIHSILSIILLIAGAWIGYCEGVYWWRKIYEENAIARWREEWKKKLAQVSVLKLIFAGILLMGFSAAWFTAENLGTLPRPGEMRDGQKIRTSDVQNLDVSGWKIYRDENIEFQYPSEALLNPKDWTFEKFSVFVSESDLNGFKYEDASAGVKYIYNKDKKWANAQPDSYFNNNQKAVDRLMPKKLEMQFEAYKYEGGSGYCGWDSYFIPLPSKRVMLEIRYAVCGDPPTNEDTKTFGKNSKTFLETFKLIGNDFIDTSTWKTYRNEKYGFEMKYPEDWQFHDTPSALCKPFNCLFSLTKPASNQKETDEDFHDGVTFIFSSAPNLNGDVTSHTAYFKGYSSGTSFSAYGFNGSTESENEYNVSAFRALQNGSVVIIDWYRAGVTNEDLSYDKFLNQILSTFKFIKQSGGYHPFENEP